MKKKIILFTSILSILLLVTIAILINSNKSIDNYSSATIKMVSTNNELLPENLGEEEGYTLMKENCYVCHNPNTKSHDDILAPPFKAVKNKYTQQYETKESFTNAIVKWVQNPLEDNALMFGAIMKFRVMPKLPMETKELEKIANYIYDNDVEEPEWMEDHQKEMKGNGNGHGKNGKGKGMGNGKGKGRGMNMYNN